MRPSKVMCSKQARVMQMSSVIDSDFADDLMVS